MNSNSRWEKNTTFCVKCGSAVAVDAEECHNCGRRLTLRQLERIDLPDGWIEHEGYAERMWGVVAAYRREDLEYFIEIKELGTPSDNNFRVELLKGNMERAETRPVDHKDCDEYEEMEDIILELIEQCN